MNTLVVFVSMLALATAAPKAEVKGQECLRPAIDEFTCVENGAWPHQEYCDYYYDCWEGTPTLCRCTDGLLFDLVFYGCNYPQQTDCGNRTISDPSSTIAPPSTTVATEGTPGVTGDTPGPSTPPAGNTTSTARPTPPGGDFQCPSDGLFPNPEDCSTFYSCIGGFAFLEPCPDGLVFNPDPNVLLCDYPENVPECAVGVTDPSSTVAPPSTTVATEGTSTVTDDTPWPSTPPASNTTSTSRPTTPENGFQCPADGLYPNPEDCSSYYACVGGNPIFELCPDDLVFNPALLICDYPQNVPGCQNGRKKYS